MKKFILVATMIAGLSAQAQNDTGGIATQVNPLGPVEMTNVVIPGQTSRNSQRYFVINVRNTCFGINLRGVQNPLGPDSQIRLSFQLKTSSGITNGSVTYDGKTAVRTAGTLGTSTRDIPARTPTTIRAASFGNVVRIEVPVNVTATLNSDGEVIETEAPILQSYEFFQTVSVNSRMGRYMARTGPLSATVHVLQPAGSYSAEVQAAFPGQQEYCGGYHSPLMVFFDEARPNYTGASNISIGAKKSSWPEKGAPGYFIAFDKDGDKKISSGLELFGGDDLDRNGFERLKKHDSNKDGVIDAKDKDFKKLLLFRDFDGKPEIIQLSKKIISIDLKYNLEKIQAYGTRAEAREKSTFKFKDGDKEKQGEVADLWFSPIEN